MVNNKSIKKIFIYIGMICSLCLCCGFFMSEKVSAKNTSVKKVSSTLKNGTFTVSGKGKMPESAMPKAAQKKKIKKIVIKKGVTELPEDAFKNCNKATVITIASTVKKIGAMAFYNTGVKKITIPKNARSLGYGMLHNCKNLEEITVPGNFWTKSPQKKANKKDTVGTLILGGNNSNIVKKVKFSTNFNGDCQSFVGDCEGFEVLSDDPYYKSIDGCIYSKDGKILEVVPYGKSEVSIAEGCEIIDIQSYKYDTGKYINGKYNNYMYSGCGKIKKIIFPSTFKSLQGGCDNDISGVTLKKCTDIEVEFKTDKLDLDTIKILWDSYFIWKKSLAKELVRMNYATIKNDMVIIREDGGLYGYVGEKQNAEITISDEVKYIRENAFNSLLSSTSQKFSIRSVVLNNNIETLPKYAFAGNKEIKVYTNKEIMIQRYTFDNCGEYEIIRLTH